MSSFLVVDAKGGEVLGTKAMKCYETPNMSHPIIREKPNAYHMCAKIYFHTYVDVTSVLYQRNNA
jgi:hypothetical protein